MNRPLFRQSFRGLVAMVLCVSLFIPLGIAREGTAGNVQVRSETVVKDSQQKTSENKAQPLTEEEATELAAREQEPGPEVVGGALSNLHLTYIVIALAAAVLVLVLK